MRSGSGVVPYRRWLLCLLCLSCLQGLSSALLRPRMDADPPGVFLSQLARSRAREKRPEPAPGGQARIYGRLGGDGGGGFPMEGDSLEQLEPSSGEASRWSRSPRRCVRRQQSCSALPCCDACDTCYCRFFTAICYCRRIGHVCPLPRT
ncbi:uncharacterized protein LOC144067823 [Stigmatopora argus]